MEFLGPILVIALASAFVYFNWRWGVQYHTRTARFMSRKDPDPSGPRFVRRVGIAGGSFFILVGILRLIVVMSNRGGD
jgi:hypothetical protein